MKNMRYEIEDKFWDQLHAQLSDQIQYQALCRVRAEVLDLAYKQLWHQIWNKVRH